MTEGIIALTEAQIADTVINQMYPDSVYPISCVLSGSRAYGLQREGSDYDYVGVHLMDTWNVLEHPDFRERLQVVRRVYNRDLEEMTPGSTGGYISLDSFEMWKFLDLLRKGSPVIYEILYLPEIHHDNTAGNILAIMRGMLTTQIGRAAKGNAYHHWRKAKTNRKKTVMAYYRLLQAIHYLREEEFEWNAEALWEYAKPSGLVNEGAVVLELYLDPETRMTPLKDEEVEKISGEIDRLTEEVDRAMVVTVLPDRYSAESMRQVLDILKRTRARLI